MDRIESLVQVLYTPGTPSADVEQAQRELLAAQRSEQGWNLARAMLNSPNANTQFLGAQTLLVKLNTGADLPPIDAQRAEFLQLLEYAAAKSLAPFVVRKLLSVGTKLVLASDWIDGVPLIVQRISGNSTFGYDFVDSLVEDSELSPAVLRAKLVPRVTQLVVGLVTNTNLGHLRALKTLEVWATAFLDEFHEAVNQLVAMIGRFAEASDEWWIAALQTLKNLYVYESRSWPVTAKRELRATLLHLTTNVYPTVPTTYPDDDRFVAVSELAMAFSVEDFSDTALHPFIAKLAHANLVPVVDDPLAVECVGFWNQFAEEVIGGGMSTDSNALIVGVISSYWPRIRLYDGLRASDWEEFASFRTDFGDFLELAYPLIGRDLFSHLTDMVLSSLETNDWFGIESAMFGLNALADIIGDDYRGERPEFLQVQQIFRSDLWLRLPQCDNFRVKQTAVNLIGCFVDFFETAEGRPYLAVTLNYLFACLSEQVLQNTASRSIQKLCDGCRRQLVSEISAFISVYAQMRGNLLDVPHVRTVTAISNVIQAQDLGPAKAEAVNTLLDLVLSAPFPDKSAEEAHQQQLRCVAAIAKGGKDCEVLSAPDLANAQTFWAHDEHAQQITAKIRAIIQSALASADLSTVEAICDIVKAGMSETAGPFVLHESLVLEFVVAKFRAGPEHVLTPVLELAKFFVMSQRAAYESRAISALPLAAGAALMQMLDQDISVHLMSAALDLLTQLVLLASTGETSLLSFGSPNALWSAYVGLTVSDRFVTKSATLFWKEFLTTNALTSEQAAPLVHTLVQQIANQASRTELPSFVDVLKHLVAKQTLVVAPLLREYIVQNPIAANLTKLDSKTRSDYVAQLLLLKGGRRTFDVTQKFWQACRNIPNSYDPVVILD